jgi:hypothetical protein
MLSLSSFGVVLSRASVVTPATSVHTTWLCGKSAIHTHVKHGTTREMDGYVMISLPLQSYLGSGKQSLLRNEIASLAPAHCEKSGDGRLGELLAVHSHFNLFCLHVPMYRRNDLYVGKYCTSLVSVYCALAWSLVEMLGASSGVEAWFGVSGSFFLEARDELIVRRGQERCIDQLIDCALVMRETKDDLGKDTRRLRS